MNTEAAVETLVNAVPDSSQGLPDAVFRYISRTTPLVNVDLLIQDEAGRTLLAWRNDRYAGVGWHVPGGIVRFKETLETRVRKVAEGEIGAAVQWESVPVAMHQFIHETHAVRGHFISFLFACSLSSSFQPPNDGLTDNDAGYLKWHRTCPINILPVQEVYRKYINEFPGNKTLSSFR
jgi:ADP-ribose pyrophosphatase YjhB (NUDIX family)